MSLEEGNKKSTKLTRTLLHGVSDLATRMPDRTCLSLVAPQVDGIRYPDAREFINLLLLNFKHQYKRFAPTVKKRFVENLFGNAMLSAPEKINAFIKTDRKPRAFKLGDECPPVAKPALAGEA